MIFSENRYSLFGIMHLSPLYAGHARASRFRRRHDPPMASQRVRPEVAGPMTGFATPFEPLCGSVAPAERIASYG
jgi:hypothetical protein